MFHEHSLNPGHLAYASRAPEVPLWSEGYCFTPFLALGTAPTLDSFEGGYKWILLARGPVWVDNKVALVTNGMSALLTCYV